MGDGGEKHDSGKMIRWRQELRQWIMIRLLNVKKQKNKKKRINKDLKKQTG